MTHNSRTRWPCTTAERGYKLDIPVGSCWVCLEPFEHCECECLDCGGLLIEPGAPAICAAAHHCIICGQPGNRHPDSHAWTQVYERDMPKSPLSATCRCGHARMEHLRAVYAPTCSLCECEGWMPKCNCTVDCSFPAGDNDEGLCDQCYANYMASSPICAPANLPGDQAEVASDSSASLATLSRALIPDGYIACGVVRPFKADSDDRDKDEDSEALPSASCEHEWRVLYDGKSEPEREYCRHCGATRLRRLGCMDFKLCMACGRVWVPEPYNDTSLPVCHCERPETEWASDVVGRHD